VGTDFEKGGRVIYDANGKEYKGTMPWRPFFFLTLILLSFALSVVEIVHEYRKSKTIQTSFTASAPIGTFLTFSNAGTPVGKPVDNPLVIASLADRLALDQAVMAWRKAGLTVKMPRLYLGNIDNCENQSGVIACANTHKNDIILVRENVDSGTDMKTIMMHEIGHLLSVPHIQGDPLMNLGYNGEKLAAPTPFSVAIAKAAQQKLENLFER
jgi:hypothetical protein